MHGININCTRSRKIPWLKTFLTACISPKVDSSILSKFLNHTARKDSDVTILQHSSMTQADGRYSGLLRHRSVERPRTSVVIQKDRKHLQSFESRPKQHLPTHMRLFLSTLSLNMLSPSEFEDPHQFILSAFME
jgi:hypothetical protein